VRLSNGQSTATATEPTAVVDGTPVDPARIDEIFARLPEWIADAELRESFNWPAESLPPPRTGETVDVPFPAATQEAPPEVPTGPLEVLRFQPEGEVTIAPFVSVTFNQPMVPIGTVTQLDSANIPATIFPAIEGRWQWIGTRTLRFDASSDLVDRLPMATEYTVNIPAGTTSASGAELAADVSWTFATPPVQVTGFVQRDAINLDLDTVFVATFDQRIDQAAVLASITVTADDDERQIRLATAEEIAADDSARQIADSAPEGRWIALRASENLPTDSSLTIAIGPETPSAEGTRVTTEATTFSARTYAPLKVIETNCSGGSDCPPGSDFNIQFNNPIDPAAFDPASITVSPELKGLAIGFYGDTINIRGRTQGRTDYTVTLPAALTDTFGQTLGKDDTVKFDVSSADKALQQFQFPLTTLDPQAEGRSLPVISINHDELKVTTYRVTPQDWSTFIQYYLQVLQGDPAETPDAPWQPTNESTIEITADKDETAETQLDLSKYLDGGRGHVVVYVESTEKFSPNSDEYWQNRPTLTWVQATDIGLDAIVDSDELSMWSTSLTTGAPLDSVAIQLVHGVAFDYGTGKVVGGPLKIDATATTDAKGLATAKLIAGDSNGQGTGAAIATLGDDSAILPSGYFGESWQSSTQADELRWFTFDDRQIYRPGETVSLKGWVRRKAWSTDGQLALLASGTKLVYTVSDSQGAEIGNGTTEVNALGGFDLTAEIPAGANLGYASINLSLQDVAGIDYADAQHSFQIEEFRRPEFEVTARNESPAPYLSSKPATVAVDASYFAGGPLGAAKVNWQVSTSTGSYSPPGWSDFTFGIWTPWWFAGDFGATGRSFESECCFDGPFPGGEVKVEQFTGTTNADGTHFLQIDFDKPEGGYPDLPVTVSAQATVEDVNRQALGGSTSLLVHPGQLYVGLASDRTFVKQGDPLNINVIVTDIDGAAVAGRAVTVTAERLESVFGDGTWSEQPVATETCDTTSAAESTTCTFATGEGGTYRISSTITDDDGGKSRTELTRWVSGGDAKPARNVEQEVATIIPDKASYQPGETAELLVQSPFSPATGLLTTHRNGIVATEVFEITDGSAVVTVPIGADDIPSLSVTVEVVGSTQRTGDDGKPLVDAPPRTAYAVGSLSLSVPATAKTLTVTAAPAADEVTPGSDTTVDVTVTDADGQPVEGAEFAVVVVDEAVLSLSNYMLGSPIDTFFADYGSYLQTVYGRQSIVLANPDLLNTAAGPDGEQTAATEAAAAYDDSAAETSAAPAAAPPAAPADGAARNTSAAPGAGQAGQAATPIDLRTNFDALAVFEPEVLTDAAGRATIAVPLPDNLTRYRVMVVAVDGADHFGSTESNITARLPLMVRPSAPRFLNFGDQFELPIIVQNQTDQAMDVDVVLQADNLTVDGGSGTGTTGKRVSVPANDRVEVRFESSASEAGTAKFRVAAASGELADAASIELPVYTPATTEAFATYGVLDGDSIIQPVLAPTGVIPQFGGLDITTSSTSLQALTDAVLYISEYPYQSADAASSRIQAISALRPVLDAFDAPGLPSAAELDGAVIADIERLRVLQNDDGGFAYWKRGQDSEPFLTIQAAHALVLAKEAGYAIPQSTLDVAMSYMFDIENRFLPEYSEEVRDSLSAYALNVRALNGDRDTTKAEALWTRRGDKMSLDAVAWIWPVIDDQAIDTAIERLFVNQAVETAGAANFSTNYGDDAYVILHSDRRSDGIILDALISERPQSDLIPKVVTGLLGNQTRGRWDNIQENAFILLALKRYFETYEAQTPDFVAKVWLGDRYAGEQTFDGRSIDRNQISIPTADVIAGGNSNIVIARAGTGRLYYRLGLRYAPEDLTLDPLDRGFVVDRTYEAVDDPADVSRDADGTWRIKPGARVRVKLSLVAESQRTHVALVDPLPAGFEILNPSLATTGPVPPQDPGEVDGFGNDWYGDGWYGTWFDHQNLRDDRAEAFSSWLPAGTYDYSYVVRATTPGTFVTPPTRAEEIYAPETFGRGSTATVIVG
jgi:alpha-2-macroglobulin